MQKIEKMKKSLIILTIGICLCFVSCKNKNNEKTPEGVTSSFVKSFNTGDFQGMYKYSTAKSKNLIDNLSQQRSAEDLEIIKSRQLTVDSTVVKEQTDSTATCVCYFKIKEKDDDRWQNAYQEWPLQKEGEDWKIMLVRP